MATADPSRVWCWCVCGRETGRPWDLIQDGMSDRDAAAEWLAGNHRHHLQYVRWSVDWYGRYPGGAAAGVRPAASYYDRNPDGSLSERRGGQHVHFCD